MQKRGREQESGRVREWIDARRVENAGEERSIAECEFSEVKEVRF